MGSNRVVSQRRDHGSSYYRGLALNHIDMLAIRAIWVGSYLHWDFVPNNSHYTQPISFGWDLQ